MMANSIINEIGRVRQGISVINKDKIAYYNRQEILEGNLDDLNFESFIIKVSDVIDDAKLRSHVLDEDSSAILIIGDLSRTRQECISLSRLLDRVFTKYDDEIISSIIGIPFEKNDIFNIIEGLTFDLTIGQHSKHSTTVPTIRLRSHTVQRGKQQRIVNKDIEIKILELLKKVDIIVSDTKNREHLLDLYYQLQNLDKASNNEIKEMTVLLKRIKKIIENEIN